MRALTLSKSTGMQACLAVTTLVATPVLAGESLDRRISPRVSVEPAVVAIDAIVERHAGNRGLQIRVQSAAYCRSSFVQLDGDAAPRVTSVRFPSLPAGSYEVRTVLFGPGQTERASVSRQMEVLGRTGG